MGKVLAPRAVTQLGPDHAATRPPGRPGAVYRAVGRQRPGPGAARDGVLRALGGGMPHTFRRRAQFPGPAVYALPTAPDDPLTGSCRSSRKRPWEINDEVVRIGRASGVRRSRPPPPGALMTVRVSGRRGKAANREKQLSKTLARVFAGWRTGLPGPVLVLQAGEAVNYFGTGLILPFEIIYLHQVRNFPAATAGLVLALVFGTAAVVKPFSGALLDRFRAKPILITGNLASALGYAGFAFVDRPWQAFVCAAVGGAGFGVANTANEVLSLALVSAEQRASSIALRRVAGNFGMGSGATVAGFIVASAG